MKRSIAVNLQPKEPTSQTKKVSGVIADWNEARGFGWVEVEGKRSFAHIRDFGRQGRRPKLGDEVSFLPGKDPKGRDCATHLRFKGGAHVAPRMGLGNGIILLALVLLPIAAGLKLESAPWIVGAWLLMASRMSWLQYSFDKERAQAGMARLSEWTLLGADLVGGWPGGFIAQRKLRHKSRKLSYQLKFWGIVALWQWAAFEVTTGGVVIRIVRESFAW